MKTSIYKIGKPAFSETSSMVRRYAERCKFFGGIDDIQVKEGKSSQDGSFLKPEPSAGHILITLDEGGKQWSSTDLAQRFTTWSEDPQIKSVSFLIGGPYGLSDEIKSMANSSWSLSKATLPSDLAWLICWEQVFRAHSIIQGTGYHHG